MNTGLFTEASLAVQVHVAASIPALLLGPLAMARKRRDWPHRTAGGLWVLAMLTIALSSFAIHDARIWGPFSPIHLLSILTLIGLWSGLRALLRGDRRAHGRAMVGLYVQALIGAGVFTFLPGRRMNAVFFPDQPWTGFWVVAVFGGIAATLILYRADMLPGRARRASNRR